MMMPFCLYLVWRSKSFIVRMIGAGGVLVALVRHHRHVVARRIARRDRGGAVLLVVHERQEGARRRHHVRGPARRARVRALQLPDRMGGLSDTSEDTSAQARLTTWKASMKMAIDYPLGVGAGNFSSAYGRYYLAAAANSVTRRTNGSRRTASISARWANTATWAWDCSSGSSSPSVIDNMKVRARLARARRRSKNTRGVAQHRGDGLVAFAVCGTFLGGLSYPHLFLLCGLTVANKRIVGLVDNEPKGNRVRGRAVAPRRRAARDRCERRRIKVVQLTGAMDFGGLENVIGHLARGLDPARFEVRCCARAASARSARSCARKGPRSCS